jgi:hypothetical protein
MRRRPARVSAPRSGFAGFRFPPEVITLAVRWYLRFGLSYRDVEELLAERGIEVDPSPSTAGCSGHATAHQRSPAMPTRPGRSLVR